MDAIRGTYKALQLMICVRQAGHYKELIPPIYHSLNKTVSLFIKLTF